MKTKIIIATLAIGFVFTLTSQAGAWGNGYGRHNCDGPMMNGGGMGMMNGGGMGMMGNRADLTPEQQQKVKDIQASYQDKLQPKQDAITAKIAAMDKAFADDKTTMAQVRAMRQELFNLKQEYRQVRRDMNLQISDELGVAYFGGMGRWNCAMNGSDMAAVSGMGQGMGRGMGGNMRHRCNW